MAKYKELNMSWIIKSFEELHRMMNDAVEIKHKFNAIFGLKLIFDIGDLFLINLIEIYFLPKLLSVALFEANKPSEKRGADYFAQNGYPKDTPDIAKMSLTWVRLATEIICVAA